MPDQRFTPDYRELSQAQNVLSNFASSEVWSTRKRNEIRVFGATPRAVALNRSAFCGCANAMRHAMQLGFRNRTEFIPPAGLVLWQDAAVNHEKNESARSQRRRPSHRVGH